MEGLICGIVSEKYCVVIVCQNSGVFFIVPGEWGENWAFTIHLFPIPSQCGVFSWAGIEGKSLSLLFPMCVWGGGGGGGEWSV